MTQIKDGGPAFPELVAIELDGHVIQGYSGMRLRDYFAAAALQGLIAHLAHPLSAGAFNREPDLSVTAYTFADAMLKARDVTAHKEG